MHLAEAGRIAFEQIAPSDRATRRSSCRICSIVGVGIGVIIQIVIQLQFTLRDPVPAIAHVALRRVGCLIPGKCNPSAGRMSPFR